MAEYHEPVNELTPQARDYSRALKSLKEEIEAIDWYHQRVVTCSDENLRKILEHNRDEEIEHACMAIEWLRKNMPGWEEQLKLFLFKETMEHNSHDEETDEEGSTDLGIGKIK